MENARAIELISQIRNGDENAFTELYNGFYRMVYSICLKIVEDNEIAKDTTSEVFVKVWHKLDKWDSRKGKFCSWLTMVARNASIDKMRPRVNKVEPRLLTETEIANGIEMRVKDKSVSPLEALVINEFSDIVQTALKSVRPRRYAKYFQLKHCEGWTVREIAEAMELKEGTVKIGIYRAKLQLREILARVYPEVEELL